MTDAITIAAVEIQNLCYAKNPSDIPTLEQLTSILSKHFGGTELYAIGARKLDDPELFLTRGCHLFKDKGVALAIAKPSMDRVGYELALRRFVIREVLE